MFSALLLVMVAAGPQFGTPVDASTVASWDSSIPPSGKGLPDGHGTVAEGQLVYNQKCIACHGVNGSGQPADPLTGGIGTLASPKPVKTVASFWPYATTLFDYIRRAMPISQPRSLSSHEVYALVAYILSVNGIVKKDAVMDAETLPKVKMPNRDGFINAFRATPR
jgi:S-disulfanyl-L-cysteine oxidoreductase SoxD